MKKYLLENCAFCPEKTIMSLKNQNPMWQTGSGDRAVCWKAKRIIEDEMIIPAWCPLEDDK